MCKRDNKFTTKSRTFLESRMTFSNWRIWILPIITRINQIITVLILNSCKPFIQINSADHISVVSIRFTTGTVYYIFYILAITRTISSKIKAIEITKNQWLILSTCHQFQIPGTFHKRNILYISKSTCYLTVQYHRFLKTFSLFNSQTHLSGKDFFTNLIRSAIFNWQHHVFLESTFFCNTCYSI